MAVQEREELYEIVPSESYLDVSYKSSALQREIDEIKEALKSSAGLARVEADAQAIISKMLSMIETSQKLVEQVSSANQQLALKVQNALDRMNKTNEILSEKLGTILDAFGQASESMGEEPDETAMMVKSLNSSIEMLVEQNSKILEALSSIDRSLKRGVIRPAIPQRYAAPVRKLQPAQIVPQQYAGENVPPGFAEELPPPPFPP